MNTALALPLPTFDGYRTVRVLRHGAVHKARVLEARRGEQHCVIKDLAPMHPMLRALYGRRMLEREARVLERLDGLDEVPRLVERISRDAIAIQFVGRRLLNKKMARRPQPILLQRLEDAVAALHARGVVHLDLRQRRNIIVKRDLRIRLLDFESAWDLSSGLLRRRLLFPLLARVDRAAVLKWRYQLGKDALSRDQRRRVKRYYVWKRVWLFKKIGRRVRRLFGNDLTRQ